MNRNLSFAALGVASAAMLSLPFLAPHCGGFALVGFVPLLWMDRIATRDGVRHFFLWHYLTFLLWNFLTTFWVCNATFAGGIFVSLVNAAMMSLVWALFRLSRKRFSGVLPYIFLASAWIAWERFYFDAEISWPWLTLGNAFARSTTCVQWYELTGTLGGSLWVWACNLSVFGLGAAPRGKLGRKARTVAIAATVLVFAGPLTASWIRYASLQPVCEEIVDVALCQTNFDPYEKFTAMSQEQQNAVLQDQMDGVMRSRGARHVCGPDGCVDVPARTAPLLIVAPETFAGGVVLGNLAADPTLYSLRKTLARYPSCEANLLLGASTYHFIEGRDAPSYTARPAGRGRWYENHNSALVIDSSPRVGVYHKSRLVPGTEKMPWPRVFSKIDEWLGGGVIARCTGQDGVSLLDLSKGASSRMVPFGCAVCYESVYPEYFASFVGAGARFMTVITNDAWWGNTPGYRQHLSYSCLRAIETRRDIARCANTGISAIINQRGDIVSETSWWERTTLQGSVALSSALTPYVRWGDVTGRICTLLFVLLSALLLVRFCINSAGYGRKG